MKTATSLTVIAIGAILAFAVTASPSFLNVQIVGWILVITGVIGLALSRNHREWLRRTVIVRGSPEASRASRRGQPRRRRPRQLTSAEAAQAAHAAPAPPSTGARAPASPDAPTEVFEPVTIEEFTEQ
jgi:hypothetical protein